VDRAIDDREKNHGRVPQTLFLEMQKFMYGCEWDYNEYRDKPPLLPTLARMIWKVHMQGISNIIQLERDLDNTREKIGKKQNQN
jgi:hypothetical protein